MAGDNPFRVGELVRGSYFTDRAEEVRTVRQAMEHRGRLLVQGPRRMGKSTIIGVAGDRVRRAGGLVLSADLAAITTLTEAADRLLSAVSRQAPWRERLWEWVRSLAPTVTLGADATGQPRLSVSMEARPRREEGERLLLERVLDRIEEVAASSEQPVVVVLDEFQRLAELGGEPAEWLLRNRMQEHRHVAYVCAGSHEGLIREMLQPKRAFHGFFEQLHVGPIAADHLARWIEERLRGTGVETETGVGMHLLEQAGPRTQDILHAARLLWYRGATTGSVVVKDVGSTVTEIVSGDEASLRRTWDDLTPVQQRVLRAVAAGADQLHASETRDAFGLGASSTVSTALDALLSRGILVREETLRFDNPFFREWVRQNVLSA